MPTPPTGCHAPLHQWYTYLAWRRRPPPPPTSNDIRRGVNVEIVPYTSLLIPTLLPSILLTSFLTSSFPFFLFSLMRDQPPDASLPETPAHSGAEKLWRFFYMRNNGTTESFKDKHVVPCQTDGPEFHRPVQRLTIAESAFQFN